MTSQVEGPFYPTEVLIRTGEGGLSFDSVVLLNQLRSLDRQRLARRLGKVGGFKMRAADRVLGISLGLVELDA